MPKMFPCVGMKKIHFVFSVLKEIKKKSNLDLLAYKIKNIMGRGKN